MLLRLLGNVLDFIVDVAMSSPRKGPIIPPERVPSDLLNAPESARCRCMDCVCGFNKPDPNARPGQ